MKYVLFLVLCGVGCAFSMSGMGSGLVSMSPLRRSRRCNRSFIFCGVFFLFLCVLYRCLLFFVEIKFMVCLVCCIFLLCVLCWFLFVWLCVLIIFVCFLLLYGLGQ
jgi:hypothetical protein